MDNNYPENNFNPENPQTNSNPPETPVEPNVPNTPPVPPTPAAQPVNPSENDFDLDIDLSEFDNPTSTDAPVNDQQPTNIGSATVVDSYYADPNVNRPVTDASNISFEPEIPSSYSYQAAGPEQSQQQPPKKKKKGLKVFLIILAVVVGVAACTCGGYLIGTNLSQKNNNTKSYSSDKNTNSNTNQNNNGKSSDFDVTVSKNRSGNQMTYAEVAQIAGKSVVTITVYTADGQSGASASGVIMSSDGYVLTNDHIYTDCVNPLLLVTLADGTEYRADFVSGDTRSDLSIIKLRDASNLPTATFGSSDALVVGEEVMAIGASDGYSDTVTNGIVSAKDRRVSYTSDNYSIKLIQTNTVINPGSSGGALVNMSGQVVGITSSKIVSSDTEGICFAIPSDYALDIVANMQANGKVVGRAKLGINYVSLGTVSAEVNNLPVGVYISGISSESDLTSKGVSKGDVIVKANGKQIKSGNDLLDIIEACSPGDEVSLEVYKASNGSYITVTTKLLEYVGTTNYQTSTTNANDTVSYPSKNSGSGGYDYGDYGGYGYDDYSDFFNNFFNFGW